jgi:hypothetical protein
MIEDYKLNRLARQTQVNRKPKKSVFMHSEDDDDDDANISNFNLGFDKLSNNDYKKPLFESPPRSTQNNLFGSTPSPPYSTQNNLFTYDSPPRSTQKKHAKSPVKSPRKSPTRGKKHRTPTKGGKGNKKTKKNKT